MLSAHLVEKGWRRLISSGPQPASRSEFMKVLSSIEAILIRAIHASQTNRTYLSDVSLDTAIETETSNERSTTVEICRCPVGYSGTSCEVWSICVILRIIVYCKFFNTRIRPISHVVLDIIRKQMNTVQGAHVILMKRAVRLARTRGLHVSVSLDIPDLHATF